MCFYPNFCFCSRQLNTSYKLTATFTAKKSKNRPRAVIGPWVWVTCYLPRSTKSVNIWIKKGTHQWFTVRLWKNLNFIVRNVWTQGEISFMFEVWWQKENQTCGEKRKRAKNYIAGKTGLLKYAFIFTLIHQILFVFRSHKHLILINANLLSWELKKYIS